MVEILEVVLLVDKNAPADTSKLIDDTPVLLKPVLPKVKKVKDKRIDGRQSKKKLKDGSPHGGLPCVMWLSNEYRKGGYDIPF